MTNTKTLFIILLLLMLACRSTAPIAVMSLPASTRAPPATETPAPLLCQIKTGVEDGKVNLRTCGGTYCPNVTILHEGDTLTQTAPETVDGWTPVKSSGGLQGWVNSKYCKGK